MQRLENLETRPDTVQPAGTRSVDLAEDATPESADRWKRALKGVVAAAFRLHHYRFVRTRMLHDALSASPGGTRAGDPSPVSRPENPPENSR